MRGAALAEVAGAARAARAAPRDAVRAPRRSLSVALVAAGAAFGLGACTHSEDAEPRPRAAVDGTDECAQAEEAPQLELAVHVPEAIATGVDVPVSLTVRNTSNEAVDLELAGRPIAFDLIVSDASGAEVWRRLGGAVPDDVERRRLGPGELLSFSDIWPQRDARGEPVPPGRYSVSGVLPLAASGCLESPASPVSLVD